MSQDSNENYFSRIFHFLIVIIFWLSYMKYDEHYVYTTVFLCTLLTLELCAKSVISGFHRYVNKICALLGFYAKQNCNSVPTFRDNLSAPSSRVKLGPLGCHEMSVQNCRSRLRKTWEERKSCTKCFVKLWWTFLCPHYGNTGIASVLSRRTPVFPKFATYLLKAQQFFHLVTYKEHFNSKLVLYIFWTKMVPRLIHKSIKFSSTTSIFTKNIISFSSHPSILYSDLSVCCIAGDWQPCRQPIFSYRFTYCRWQVWMCSSGILHSVEW
jgi:hypothetical protein